MCCTASKEIRVGKRAGEYEYLTMFKVTWTQREVKSGNNMFYCVWEGPWWVVGEGVWHIKSSCLLHSWRPQKGEFHCSPLLNVALVPFKLDTMFLQIKFKTHFLLKNKFCLFAQDFFVYFNTKFIKEFLFHLVTLLPFNFFW